MPAQALTKQQRQRLAVLEPELRACVRSADLSKAKRVVAEIQHVLRPTGHETRILQAKNWLYETAMEEGSLTFAKLGFQETIKKSNPNTRLHLEATALLAICCLRDGDIENAQTLVVKAVKHINNIKSPERRKQFHIRLPDYVHISAGI